MLERASFYYAYKSVRTVYIEIAEGRKTEKGVVYMEDNNNNQPTGTPTAGQTGDKGGKVFSQTDMDNLAGKIRAEEKAKNEQAVKDAVANAIAEYERQAKLSEDEREREAKSKREAELKEREEKITLRERRLEAQELLQAKKIPIDLVDFVVDLDINKTKENVEKLAKTYNKSVETGVTDKLKGNPPTDFSNKTDTEKSKKIIGAF